MLKEMKLTLLGLTFMGCIGCDSNAVGKTYADIVHASYEDSLTAAKTLKTAVDAFVASPSADTLAAAKTAWLESREPYLQTEVYRFYDGPIDNPDNGPEGLLNGPQINPEGKTDVVQDQAQVDDLLASLGF